jgi:DNA-binding SARP family transcriptional activator
LLTREKTERTGRRVDVVETARRLRDSGQWKELADALNHEHASEFTPELWVMSAHAAYMTGDAHRAVEIVDRVLSASDDIPVHTRAYALLVRSGASRFRGFTQKALEDASAATAMLEAQTSPPELLIQGHKQIGISLATIGELDGAIDHLERALRFCARSSNLNLQAEIQNALGLAYFRLGRLPEAQVHYKNAAAAFGKLDSKAALADLYNNMGWLHFNLAEYQLALDYYRRSLDLARSANYSRTVSMATVNLGDVHLALGRFDEAIQSYEEALRAGADALEPRLFCCANTGLGSVFRALKDPRKSRFYLDQAIFEARRLNLRHELATAGMVEGELAMDQGDYDGAREALEASAAILKEIGALRPLVRTCLRLGHVYLKTRRWRLLRENLSALARVVQQLDSSDQLIWEARDAQEVINYAASKRIGGAVFSSIRARLRDRRAAPGRVAPSTPAPDGDVARLPRLEARSFGGFQIRVDGRSVSAVEWESLKAQEFFAYLLCNRRGKDREELMEVLWPDISVGLSRNAFHNNVYRSRRALYSGCVVLEEGRYRINPAGEFWFDLEEFRRLSSEAECTGLPVRRRLSLLSEANSLYAGEFLDGMKADWITPIRMETEALHLANLSKIARYQAEVREFDAAIKTLGRAVDIDPTDVANQEMLVRLLVRAGNLPEARKRHESFRHVMRDELGSEPPKDFTTLCELALTTR